RRCRGQPGLGAAGLPDRLQPRPHGPGSRDRGGAAHDRQGRWRAGRHREDAEMTAGAPALALAMTGEAVRLLAGLGFRSAAAGKLRHWSELEGVVRNYQVLPGPMAPIVAVALPPFELVIGVALIAWPRPQVLGVATGLLLVFAFAMGANLMRGRAEIDC